MNTYLWLKTIHIISSTVLFGTGIGIAYFKWAVDRRADVRAIRVVSERVVIADWLFTMPAVIVQPLTGIAMALEGGYPLFQGWLAWSLALYVVAGACWVPVVWLQLQMRELARFADAGNTELDQRYWRYARYWFGLGVPAFVALLIVYALMVFKPG